MYWQGQSQRALISEVSKAQLVGSATSEAMAACAELTPRAMVWTLTRRNTQGKAFEASKAACEARLNDLKADDAQGQAQLAKVRADTQQLVTVLLDIQQSYTEDSKLAAVGRLEREVKPLAKAIEVQLKTMVDRSDALVQNEILQLTKNQERNMALGAAFGGGLALCGALFVRRAMRGIMKGIGQAVHMAETLADGDLRPQQCDLREDEIGLVTKAMDRARIAWVEAMRNIQRAATEISAASEATYMGARNVEQSSQQAAANLRQTNQAMGGLQNLVQQSAQSAGQAVELAVQANGTAHSGGQAVAQIVNSMQNIHTSSSKIAEIIGVIDGIAFQTNILALNAAVEAARAGSQGLGFAVVAAEVRALAQRSGTAAGEIRSLIGASVEQVKGGVDSAQGASSHISEVGVSIEQVSDIIQDVTQAVQRQNIALDDIANAVRGIDQLTQKNAGVVQDWAASAKQMQGTSTELNHLVAGFKLPDSGAQLGVAILARAETPEHGAVQEPLLLP